MKSNFNRIHRIFQKNIGNGNVAIGFFYIMTYILQFQGWISIIVCHSYCRFKKIICTEGWISQMAFIAHLFHIISTTKFRSEICLVKPSVSAIDSVNKVGI